MYSVSPPLIFSRRLGVGPGRPNPQARAKRTFHTVGSVCSILFISPPQAAWERTVSVSVDSHVQNKSRFTLSVMYVYSVSPRVNPCTRVSLSTGTCTTKKIALYSVSPLLSPQAAWGRAEGVSVDTHMHRVVNRLGWTGAKGPVKTPDTTRKRLESWLPSDLWAEISPLLVGFGQERCSELRPLCGDCPLMERGLCHGPLD